MHEFDYVIVGAGSAGCCIAARLAEDGRHTVALIEAGKKKGGLIVDMPALVIKAVPPNKKNWNYWTKPQTHLNNRRLYWPRGKVLGGSSAINGMLYIRGHARDYDEWSQLGCRGWSYADVLPYFKKSEHTTRASGDYHGHTGPLKVTIADSINPLNHAFIKAGKSLNLPFTEDFNGEDQFGVGWYDQTIAGGRRQSAATAFLSRSDKMPNLKIFSETQARRILFDGKKAIGVDVTQHGKIFGITARREVILCGGTINSPQLLQLSGVGDPDDISPFGIKMRHQLNGVGKNLQDHLDVFVGAKINQPISFRRYQTPHHGMIELAKWFMGQKSALGQNLLPVGAFAKTDPALERPDIQLHILLGYGDKPHGIQPARDHGFGIHVCQLRPHSRGTITLASGDPLTPARIDPNYLSAAKDQRVMCEGVKLVLEMMQSKDLSKFVEKMLAPWSDMGSPNDKKDNQRDDQIIIDAIKNLSETIYHPVGTCMMGHKDNPEAVVDPCLKVIGLENLRVADASVMPRLIGGNTNAPTIMIGEKAADMIKANVQ